MFSCYMKELFTFHFSQTVIFQLTQFQTLQFFIILQSLLNDVKDLLFLGLLLESTFEVTNELLIATGRRWLARPINTSTRRKQQGFTLNLVREMELEDDESFFSFTRMHIPTFYKLLRLVGPYFQKISLRESITPKERLLTTL